MRMLSALKKQKNWIISASLLAAGIVLVISAKREEGWDQAWRVEVGAAIALLGPLYFIEELLRSRVALLEERLNELRKSYGLIRRLLPQDDARTYVLDRLLEAVTKQARKESYPPEEIARLLRGDEETRTIALAAMQGDHKLVNDAAIIRSIAASDSGMEQYHALKVAHESWLGRPAATKAGIVDAIQKDTSSRQFISADKHRTLLADEILQRARTEGLLA